MSGATEEAKTKFRAAHMTYTFKLREFRGTVADHEPFDVKKDCEVLYNGMKGLGTNEEDIIQVLCNRSNKQRQQIIRKYEEIYGKNLIKDLHSDLSGDFYDFIVGLMHTPRHFDAEHLRAALRESNMDLPVIIEILGSRSSEEILGEKSITSAYKKVFGRDLAGVVHDSNIACMRLKRFFTRFFETKRDPTDTPKSSEEISHIAKSFESGGGFNDEALFSLFIEDNFATIQAVFEEYEKQTNKCLKGTLMEHFTNEQEFVDVLCQFIKMIRNRPAYFAEKLYIATKGPGTDENTLNRVVISRSEIDMLQIMGEFHRMYDKSLESFVSGDTSGDYKRAILEVLKH